MKLIMIPVNFMKLPRRITVGRVLASRYSAAQSGAEQMTNLHVVGGKDRAEAGAVRNTPERPFVWDERFDGVDKIETTEGEVIELWSEGMQSPPKPGWVILLREKAELGLTWTLYSLPKGAEISKLVQELPVL